MPMSWEQYIRDEDAKADMEERGDEMLRAITSWGHGDYYENDHERPVKSIAHSVYKYTECGAWFTVDYEAVGVRLGSIVEGAEQTTEVLHLVWPFTQLDFEGNIQEVEVQADEIWKATHGCPGCAALWGREYEVGATPVHASCPECDGDGIII